MQVTEQSDSQVSDRTILRTESFNLAEKEGGWVGRLCSGFSLLDR